MLQECLHAEVCQSRAKEYRRKVTPLYPVHIHLVAGAVQQFNIIHQLLVVGKTDDILQVPIIQPIFLACNLLGAAHGSRKGGYLPAETVIYALKVLAASNGPVDRTGADSQDILNLIHQFIRVPCLTVKFVDECKDGDMAHDTDLKELNGLGLHTLGTVNDHDG